MVTAVPVSRRITIVNGKERYSNGSIKMTAQNDGLLMFAKALNSLQYNAPADKFTLTDKSELKTE